MQLLVFFFDYIVRRPAIRINDPLPDVHKIAELYLGAHPGAHLADARRVDLDHQLPSRQSVLLLLLSLQQEPLLLEKYRVELNAALFALRPVVSPSNALTSCSKSSRSQHLRRVRS